ncbi:MAG TPA: thioesterase family protein [Hanamia sp.]|jgi:acyl-CoA thioester hydrolase|nr:thioesterase family protein [Hanamia sp.]
MPRIKIELPQKLLASVSIPVRITDINYGNHLAHNSIVEIIHEARVQFLNQYGFTELNVGGTALIMGELLVEFKNESFYNDLLKIRIFSGEITGVSFELFYEITVNRKEEKIVIALAKTGMVCYNYAIKKVRPMPAELRLIL